MIDTPPSPSKRANPRLAMKIRQLHVYISMLIAPSILFFAITGLVQIYHLHEAHGTYQPPAIIEQLGALHKDQELAAPHHHEPAEALHEAAAPEEGKSAPKLSVIALKLVFAAVALGLVATTCFGIWMGLNATRKPRLCVQLLICGAAIPLITLLLP